MIINAFSFSSQSMGFDMEPLLYRAVECSASEVHGKI